MGSQRRWIALWIIIIAFVSGLTAEATHLILNNQSTQNWIWFILILVANWAFVLVAIWFVDVVIFRNKYKKLGDLT